MSRRKDRLHRAQKSKTRRLKPSLKFERLENRLLLAATQWTNPLLPMDVSPDGNQSVDPLDVLVIVNELNNPVYTTIHNRKLPNLPEANREPHPYFDVDCDGIVSPLDVLAVVNTINSGIKPIGWQFDSNSSSAVGGFISSQSCGPKLHEGTSYLTEITREVVIPENATNLSFRISDEFFDRSSPTGMKDAFEVALVDQNGKSLVLPFAPNRDAFLNTSEESSKAIAPGVRWVGDQVLVNVSQIPPNTTARFIARLVNNDLDTQTSVAIRDVKVETQGDSIPISSSVGLAEPQSQMELWDDMQGFADVTGSLVLRHGRTSHVDNSGVIHSEIAVENAGDFSTQSTVRVVFKNFSDPSVRLRNPDGFTSEGDPYVDFSSAISSSRLNPGERSAYRRLGFFNPAGIQFAYEAEVYSKLNRSPEITSSPSLEALLGRPYSYQVDALDLDEDQLVYSLLMGPAGMQVNRLTGRVTWEANTETLGNHSVAIRVEDGAGGYADQHFVLNALMPPPNRPPLITSTPVTHAFAASFDKGGTENSNRDLVYQYNVVAKDPDGDTLIHSIVDGPVGMSIDPTTGFIRWTPYVAKHTEPGVILSQGLSETHYRASSIAGTPPSNAFDGNWFTSWDSQTTGPQWIEVDLGAIYPIGAIRLHVEQNQPGPTTHEIWLSQSPIGSVRSAASLVATINQSTTDNQRIEIPITTREARFVQVRTTSSPSTVAWNEIAVVSSERLPIPREEQVQVQVSDGRGGVTAQDYSIMLAPNPRNGVPLFVSEPDTAFRLPDTQSFAIPIGSANPPFLEVSGLPGEKVRGSFTFDVGVQGKYREEGVFNVGDVVAGGGGPVTRMDHNFEQLEFLPTQAGQPGGYVFDRIGNMFYGDWGFGSGNRIFRHDITGAPSPVGVFATTSVTGISSITMDLEGNIYVGSGNSRVVAKVSPQGELLDTFFPESDGRGVWSIELAADQRTLFYTTETTSIRRFDVIDKVQLPDFWSDSSFLWFQAFSLLPDGGALISTNRGVARIDRDGRLTNHYSAAYGAAIASDSKSFYTNLTQTSVGRIDLQTGQLISTIDLGGVYPYVGVEVFDSPRAATGFGIGSVDVRSLDARVSLANPTGPILSRPGDRVHFDVEITIPDDLYTGQYKQIAMEVFREGWSYPLGKIPIVFNEKVTFHYDAAAVDPDGDKLTYRLIAGPDGATIHSETGRLTWQPSSEGLFEFEIEVMDSQGATSRQVFGLTVLQDEVNDAPYFTTEQKTKTQVNQPYRDRVAAYDPDNDTVFFAFQSAPVGMQIDRSSGEIYWLPTESSIGDHPVTVVVRDGRGGETLKNYVVNVSPLAPNSPPEFLSTPQPTVITGKSWSYIPYIVDADFDYPTLDIVTAPSGMVLSPLRVLHWVPTVEQSGTHEIVLRAADGRGGVAFQPFEIVVVGNEAPIFLHPIPNQVALEVPNYSFEETFAQLNWIASNNGMFVGIHDLEDSQYLGSSRNRRIRNLDGNHAAYISLGYAFPPGFYGHITSNPLVTTQSDTEYRFTVAVGDPLDLPIVDDVVVSLIADNVVVATREITPNELKDGEFAEFVVSYLAPAEGQILQARLGQVRKTWGAPYYAFIHYDNLRLEAVEPTFLVAGSEFSKRMIAVDPDYDPIAYSIAQGPDGLAIDPQTGVLQWIPSLLQVGAHDIFLRVEDDGGGSSITSIRLHVKEDSTNRPPVLSSLPRDSIRIGERYISQIDVTDPDGDSLTFELKQVPEGLHISRDGLMSWRPTIDQFGLHSIDVAIDDGQGGLINARFDISVKSTLQNASPLITSHAMTTAIVGEIYAYQAVAHDPDGDLITWSLAQAPAGIAIDPKSGWILWRTKERDIGAHSVVVVAEDSYGGRARQEFSLQVRGTNSAPIIQSTPPTTAVAGKLYTHQVVAVDSDNDNLTYSLAGPSRGIEIDPQSGLLTWTPWWGNRGLYDVILRVSDGRSTTSMNFAIDVRGSENTNPIIDSSPQLMTIAGDLYHYPVTGIDAESDPITYSLREAPEGMSIDGSTGVLTWTPTVSDVGLKQVSIIASDPNGGRFLQSYGLRVLPPNLPPTIVSEPRLSVTRGAMYRYVVRVQHANQQIVRYELTESPPGMTIDQRGTLQWNSLAFQGSSANIGIRVSDGLGGVAEQNYVLQVNADVSAPQVIVNATPQVANLGEDVIFALEDTDNIGVVDRRLWIDGALVPLDSVGRAYVRMTTAGNIPIQALVKDAGGNEGRFEHFVQVVDPYDSDAPIAILQSPSENDIIRSITDIVGTVSDSNFAYYTLSIAMLEGEYREIARGTSSVTQSVLGTLDPSLLQNDNYRLRLEAFDTSGKSSYDERVISIAGDLKLGNFTLSFADLSVPVAGFPISVVRTYDTLTANESDDFAYGWRMEFRDTNLRTNVPKTGSEEDLIFNPFFAGARVFLQLPGGKREGFTFQPRPAPGLRGSFLGIFEPAFIPDRGVTSQLTVPNASLSLSASGDVFAYGSGQPFHPASPLFGNSYLLTTAEGITYNIDGLSGDLRSVVDLNGNEITFNDNEVASSSGPKVQFERDVQGRIVSVTDPAGQKIRYTYDRLGDLTSVTDRAGNTTRFVYRSDRPHYLEKILDPLGREGIRTEYDEHGRLARTVDSLGNAVQQEYDLANSKLTVRDQLGNPTVFEYDDEGNVVAETNALGEVTRRSYDDAGNVLEEIDPLGQKTIRTYDRFGNVLTEKDPLGNTTYTVYGPNGQVLSSLDALGNATTNQYDSKGNLLRTIAPGGLETAMSYDRSGNPTSITFGGGTMAMSYDTSGRVVEQTDARGSVTRFTYDAFGNQLTSTTQLTTPSGVRNLVTSMDYDANNRVIRTVDPEGGVTRVEYDAAGNKVADIDALGRRTEYRYDERGLLAETIYPDSTPNDTSDNPRTRTEYDAAGRPIARIDELGRRTVTRYDKIGRVIETIYPDSTPNDLSDNSRTRTEYDAAGRKAAEIDERGNRTEFEYDAAGRQTAVRDALGNVTRSTLDAGGRQIAVTDPLNRTTRFTHDASGRPVETTYADGSKTTSSFDTNGRLIRRTDQMARATRYEHDALGRLTAVIDALGQRTEYTYDEAGNLVAQKDANGNITRHEYDGLRRRVATQLPMGQRSTTQYDTFGNVVRTTDFNGDSVEYSYDPRNRLVTKTFPGGSITQFSYTLTGQRHSSEDGRGTTRWNYDERGRLISRIDPDGQSIAYTYDAVGNRTSLTTAAGTIAYSFDALNRMTSVTDPDGGTSRYAYNPVSNLVRTELPNGTWETREYDTLNRLVYLENQSPAGVISSYRYTLSSTGRRDAVEEQSGRRVAYQYDALDRLTLETITDAIFGNRSIGYSYDPVGNRLSRNDSVEGTTSYTYDDNDRLLTESLNSVVTEYAYDANGNTLSKINAVDRVFYDWDPENRLVGVDTDGNGTIDVKNVYDADGIRVAQILGTEETRYLIDTVQPYQQVALEYTPSGVIQVSYVHGLDLISQNRLSSTGMSYYHVDGLGSTRALSNASGIVTDRYIYDAFGRTIGQVGTTGNVYLYAGEQRDPSVGLDYLRARYMNPSLGRFISTDPFEGVLRDPLSLHNFQYSHANPVSNTDPTGLFSLGQVSASQGVQNSLRALPQVAQRSIVQSTRNALPDVLLFLLFAGTAGVGYSFANAVGEGFFSYDINSPYPTTTVEKYQVTSSLNNFSRSMKTTISIKIRDGGNFVVFVETLPSGKVSIGGGVSFETPKLVFASLPNIIDFQAELDVQLIPPVTKIKIGVNALKIFTGSVVVLPPSLAGEFDLGTKISM